MERAVSVIIPVYNAFSEAALCLESVLQHSPRDVRVVVIDDCSPQGDFAKYLSPELRSDSRVSLVRNEVNLGFVGACNHGMLELSGKDDVILLNSDTEVTARWVEKLAAAAYDRPKVATVTPLTNNGTICSFPRFCQDNALIPGYSLDEFAALVESVSAREYPELPSCVGFCTYIRREVIDRLKGFDAEAFGKGYGEENDFSCRAQALGYVDLLDDATFIYHKGNMSFREARSELTERNSEILRKRHPLYFDNVGRFCRAFPLRRVHERILHPLLEEWAKAKQYSVLHVLHNGPYAERHHPPGGTERHVQDIIAALPEVAHWSVVPSTTAYYLTAHLGFVDREFILDARAVTLYDIMKPEFFDLVHLQHVQGFLFGEVDAALRKHGNYVVSLHDYNLICPRVYLMTPYRKHCSGFECSEQCSFGEQYIKEYRTIASDMLGAARAVIAFSQSTQRYFERILGQTFDWKIQPHGIDVPKPLNANSIERPGDSSPLRVAFLGFVPQHKGSLIAEDLFQRAALDDGTPIEWHVIGEIYGKVPSHVHKHGRYERPQLPELFAKARPHVVVILTLCPETYCLTLDEAWSQGVPVLSTPLGAPADRVRERGGGWVVDSLDEAGVMAGLNAIVRDWDEYLACRRRVGQFEMLTTADEGRAYAHIYAAAIPKKKARIEAVLAYFEPVSLGQPPRISLKRRLVRKGVNVGIRFLERFRLRPVVERLAYSLVPERVLQNLKGLR